MSTVRDPQRPALPGLLSWVSVCEISELMTPAIFAVNLSTLAAPVAVPAPTQPCSITISDASIAKPNASSSGTVAVPVAAAHKLTLTLKSPFPSNSVAVNGVVPAGWSALASGEFASVVPDLAGIWTFVVTTPGAAPNSVAIQGY